MSCSRARLDNLSSRSLFNLFNQSHVDDCITVVNYKVQQESGWVLREGKLSLIDLADSERVLATDCHSNLRSVEAANIDRSLLALSGVITALVEGQWYRILLRNLKLTQLHKASH